MTPVHLIGVHLKEGTSPITYLQGEEEVKKIDGLGNCYGNMEFEFCGKCGCGICQTLTPYRDYYRAVYPSTFHIEETSKSLVDGGSPETGVPSSKLPDKYLPKFHNNYENRGFDWHDDLPKYKEGIQQKTLVHNNGELLS